MDRSMNLKKKGCDDMKWIEIAHNKAQLQTVGWNLHVTVISDADTAQTYSIYISEVLYIIQHGISKSSFC